METINNYINEVTSKVKELEKERDKLNSAISLEKRKIKNILTSKPGWKLFIAGYCRCGDKKDYVKGIDYYIKNGLETPNADNLSISFDGNKVIIEDYFTWAYDHEDWTFEIPITKLIDFCSSDDYMQKRIDRYKSIKETQKKKEEVESEIRERELFEKLKKKYGE